MKSDHFSCQKICLNSFARLNFMFEWIHKHELTFFLHAIEIVLWFHVSTILVEQEKLRRLLDHCTKSMLLRNISQLVFIHCKTFSLNILQWNKLSSLGSNQGNFLSLGEGSRDRIAWNDTLRWAECKVVFFVSLRRHKLFWYDWFC